MKDVYIIGNTFNDNSSAVKNEYNYNNDELLFEILDLKNKLNTQTELYIALSELADVLKKNNGNYKENSSIGKTIKKYAKEFASSFFVGIASEALIKFISNFI